MLDELPYILPQVCPAAAYVVISDSQVAPLYADALSQRLRDVTPTYGFTFPKGERHKTRKTWSTITDQMLQAGVGRDHGDDRTVGRSGGHLGETR